MVKRRSTKKSKQTSKTNYKRKNTSKKTNGSDKKQPSGYLMFCAEQRTRRKAEFEGMTAKEIMQHLGTEWRKLSPQQQQAYKTKTSTKTYYEPSDKEESQSQTMSDHQTDIRKKTSRKHNSRSKATSKTTRRKAGGRKAAQHDEATFSLST